MEGHHIAIRELDLSSHHPTTVVNRVGAVPVLKTSAAFFTFLRANLVLESAMSSAANTPQFGPSLFPPVYAPSPSPFAAAPSFYGLDEEDDIPPLSLEVIDQPSDKIESMRLVADSVAQMRQRASLNLVFHPICLAGLSAALTAIYHLGGVSNLDVGLGMTVSCGVVMSYLMGIRYLAGGYVSLAERLRWNWLRSEHGDEDTLVAARYQDDIIGTLVLRLEPNLSSAPSTAAKRRYRSSSLRGGKGVIRAWTTSMRYRGKGVGKDLLHEAVRVTRERCGKDAEISFAKQHANSAMLLPGIFNAPFRRDEARAARVLDEVLAEWDGNGKRR